MSLQTRLEAVIERIAAEVKTLRQGIQPVTTVTAATFTPTAAHAGHRVEVDRATAVTVTLPTTVPAGSRIDFLIVNTGMATFIAGSGAAVTGDPSLVTRARWVAVTAVKRSATAWVVVGGLA